MFVSPAKTAERSRCFLGLTWVGPPSNEPCIRWVNVGRVHSQPRGVTSWQFRRTGVLSKNGLTNWDAILGTNSSGYKERCVRGVQDRTNPVTSVRVKRGGNAAFYQIWTFKKFLCELQQCRLGDRRCIQPVKTCRVYFLSDVLFRGHGLTNSAGKSGHLNKKCTRLCFVVNYSLMLHVDLQVRFSV